MWDGTVTESTDMHDQHNDHRMSAAMHAAVVGHWNGEVTAMKAFGIKRFVCHLCPSGGSIRGFLAVVAPSGGSSPGRTRSIGATSLHTATGKYVCLQFCLSVTVSVCGLRAVDMFENPVYQSWNLNCKLALQNSTVHLPLLWRATWTKEPSEQRLGP